MNGESWRKINGYLPILDFGEETFLGGSDDQNFKPGAEKFVQTATPDFFDYVINWPLIPNQLLV